MTTLAFMTAVFCGNILFVNPEMEGALVYMTAHQLSVGSMRGTYIAEKIPARCRGRLGEFTLRLCRGISLTAYPLGSYFSRCHVLRRAEPGTGSPEISARGRQKVK